MVRPLLAVLALLATLTGGPASAASQPPAPSCEAPVTVGVDAAPLRVDAGQPVVLTVMVHSPCADRPHIVVLGERPARPYPYYAQPPSRPIGTVTAPPGRVATATVTVRPERSTDYTFALYGKAYTALPFLTVMVQPAPDTPAPPMPRPTLSVDRTSVPYGGPVRVTVRSTGGRVDLYALDVAGSGPERLIRTRDAPIGVSVFTLEPTSNMVLQARMRDPGAAARGGSNAVPISVAKAVTLAVARADAIDHSFAGRVLPARAGETVRLYGAYGTGTPVLFAQTTSTRNGTYAIKRRLTESGRLAVFATTPADGANSAGRSATRSVSRP